MGQHINLCPIKGLTTVAPTTTNSASKTFPVAVDTIVSDGTNWCIKYSDGWIEQGGYVTVSNIAAYGAVQVAFNTTIDGVDTTFTAAPVYVHCTATYPSATGSDFAVYAVEDVSATGFTYRKTNNDTYLSGFYWTAKGI